MRWGVCCAWKRFPVWISDVSVTVPKATWQQYILSAHPVAHSCCMRFFRNKYFNISYFTLEYDRIFPWGENWEANTEVYRFSEITSPEKCTSVQPNMYINLWNVKFSGTLVAWICWKLKKTIARRMFSCRRVKFALKKEPWQISISVCIINLLQHDSHSQICIHYKAWTAG